tara:strand:- start:292 stop:843 length:552 start_codon:yes stop_codon:yes gene_type:complete
MASKLTTWINAKLKAKGTTATVEKKKASKYKSISAAKKAGSLYYEDKNGNPKIAATASDLDNTPKTTGVTRSLRPKLRPNPADRGDINTANIDAKGNSRPGFDKFKKGQKIRDIVEPALKDSAPTKKIKDATKGLTGNAKKLAAWKAGERTLSMKERGRLYKWARSKGISVPKSLYDLPDNYK